MANILCQVSLPSVSFLPEDQVINTFSFRTADVAAATLEILRVRLSNFYTNIQAPGTAAIRTFIAASHLPTNMRVKMYDRAEPAPRVPLLDAALTVGTGSGLTGLPAEVALCLSFRGPLASGVPAARRRGRVFIGPLAGAILVPDTTNNVRPALGLQNALVGAGRVLMNASDTTADWQVWSDVGAAGVNVVHCWSDDAFDTQRRRGVKTLSRITRNLGATS